MTQLRQNSSVSSYSSQRSDNGSLYPGDEDTNLLQSTTGSLWRQYSLIAQNYQVKIKVKQVCCANDKLRPWLLKGAFLVVVAVGLFFSSMELRFSSYAQTKLNFNGGDQILVPTSTYFNEKVNFTAEVFEDLKDVYLSVLKDMPSISTNVTTYSTAGSFFMASWTYQYWGLHLLKGTRLQISICADLHLQFYILRGKKKLKQWTQKTLFNNYDFHTSIHPQPTCSKIKNFKSHLLTVHDSDVYYLSFSSSVGWRFLTHVSVVLHFNRTYYDLSNTVHTCLLSNKSCHAELPYGSNRVSLLQAGTFENQNMTVNTFHKYELKYLPVPRWSFYLKLLGGIYLTVVVLTSLYTIWRLFVYYFSVHAERKPILKPLRHRSYSLLSATGSLRTNKKWVVVTPIEGSSTEKLYEIEEHDNASLVRSYDKNGGHRESISSVDEHLFLRSQNESYVGDIYRDATYNNDQQLLDSCMTSAGISAI